MVMLPLYLSLLSAYATCCADAFHMFPPIACNYYTLTIDARVISFHFDDKCQPGSPLLRHEPTASLRARHKSHRRERHIAIEQCYQHISIGDIFDVSDYNVWLIGADAAYSRWPAHDGRWVTQAPRFADTRLLFRCLHYCWSLVISFFCKMAIDDHRPARRVATRYLLSYLDFSPEIGGLEDCAVKCRSGTLHWRLSSFDSTITRIVGL